MTDSNPCAALGCAMRTEPIETCRDHRCPHRWLRESREDRARREEKDRRAMSQKCDTPLTPRGHVREED